MSFFGDLRHTPAATKPPGTTTSTTTNLPLTNLALIQSRMDTLHNLLSDSVNANTPLGQHQLSIVSSQISSAIHHLIVNAAALLSPSSTSTPALPTYSPPDPINVETDDAPIDDDYDIIEMDSVELLAEHVHFCEVCGKGFKRDANLRMHMRAHGNQFKTPEALAKPERADPGVTGRSRKVRFSCPFVGCNRNKQHKKFRPLKSAICVKNHFKRSHCPKMYSCNRCNKKSFSVVADLKSHLKHCGESKWKCSCGTSFSRKDKLFGHMALFEGHMPAVVDDVVEEKKTVIEVDDGDFDMGSNGGLGENGGGCSSSSKDGGLEGLLDSYNAMENCNWFQEGFDSPSGIDGFFNF